MYDTSGQILSKLEKDLFTTIYKHILALLNYDLMQVPKITSPVILLKPTILSVNYPEEDYGLHKVM